MYTTCWGAQTLDAEHDGLSALAVSLGVGVQCVGHQLYALSQGWQCTNLGTNEEKRYQGRN